MAIAFGAASALLNMKDAMNHHYPTVNRSSSEIFTIAASKSTPHISTLACSPPQTRGRSGEDQIAQRWSVVNCTQRTPAGLPLGMPGMGELMEGAMQHAPQPARHFI